MVEFGLVIGLLFLLLFGIVDFSRLVFNYATMSNGVREGARYAVVHPGAGNEADIIARAEQMIVLIGGTAIVEVSSPDDELAHGPFCSHLCRVVVTATTEFDAWTPVIPDLELVATATMHYE